MAPSPLSDAQIRAVKHVGVGHASMNQYGGTLPKANTWQSLMRRGVIERVLKKDLAFNLRSTYQHKDWIRLTKKGKRVLLAISLNEEIPLV